MKNLLRSWLGIDSLEKQLAELPNRPQMASHKAQMGEVMADLTNLAEKMSNALRQIAARQGHRAAESLDAGRTWDENQFTLEDWNREKGNGQ